MNNASRTSERELSDHCQECGALKIDGMDCWEQLGLLLAWEAEDPELYAEHFKTVASYNLQHPAQFTDEALVGLRDVFIEHLDDGMSIAEMRRRIGKANEGKTRVLKDKSERHPVQRYWKVTIADVYIPNHPENAAQRVRKWAEAIREQL